MNIITQRSY